MSTISWSINVLAKWRTSSCLTMGFFGLGGSRYLLVSWGDLSYQPHLLGYVSHISKEAMRERGGVSADDAEMQIW